LQKDENNLGFQGVKVSNTFLSFVIPPSSSEIVGCSTMGVNFKVRKGDAKILLKTKLKIYRNFHLQNQGTDCLPETMKKAVRRLRPPPGPSSCLLP
jgi:hypothetical protein